jgi:hypothetical protein
MKPMRMRASRTLLLILPSDCTTPPKASMRPPPLSMVCRPLIERSSVDLPEPDGPIRAIISPLLTFNETESRARREPKLFEAFRTDRTAASDIDGEASSDRRAQGKERL